MRTLFDGAVPVDYGQAYVTSRELPDMTKAFAGQVNGLCGVGEPGALFLMTGTNYGRVHLTIELHDGGSRPSRVSVRRRGGARRSTGGGTRPGAGPAAFLAEVRRAFPAVDRPARA